MTRPHSALLDDLIYSAHHGAGFILRHFGRVVPGGIYFVDAADPRMDFCFPKEDHPRAGDEEVFALVEAELRCWAAKPQTCGVAMVTEIVRDGQRVMAIQAETRDELALVHVPLRRKLWWWALGEPEAGEGLIVARFFAEDAPRAEAKGGAGY